MDKVGKLFTSFPRVFSSLREQDIATRDYVGQLGTLSGPVRQAIAQNAQAAFELVGSPANNTPAYLTILNILCDTPEAGRSVNQAELSEKTILFLLSFDAIQIRYAGIMLAPLLIRIGTGNLLPVSVSVELLAAAILRIDPAASTFTTTHLSLVKLAYSSNYLEPALPVINRDIAFFPAAKADRLLCDPALPSPNYISVSTGLSAQVQSAAVLEYHLVCGLIHIARRDWPKAQKALDVVVSQPIKDKGVSKMMIEAYKKWILVALLGTGGSPKLSTNTSGFARSLYNSKCSAYITVADMFSDQDAQQFKTNVETSASVWDEDGNASLVAEVRSTYQMWQIIRLKRVYLNVPLSTIRETTYCAETGEKLAAEDDVAALVQSMFESGMLRGSIITGPTSGTRYLAFDDSQTTLGEEDFARELATSRMKMQELGEQYRWANTRLRSSKPYVRYVARAQKRAKEPAADPGVEFDAQIEDEDLMTGIMKSS